MRVTSHTYVPQGGTELLKTHQIPRRYRILSSRQFDHKLLAVALNGYLSIKVSFVSPYSGVRSILMKLQRNGTALSIVIDALQTIRENLA
jgi:hypothetical protein